MNHVVLFVLIALASAAVAVAAGLAACMVLRRKLAGKELDDWERWRKQLSRRDAMRVMRATARQQRLDRSDLEQAQLVYVRYCQQVYERAPLFRRPRSRYLIAGGYLILALLEAATALWGNGPHRALYAVMAALFAVLGLLWLFAISRTLKRRPEQMTRLRRQIEQHNAG